MKLTQTTFKVFTTLHLLILVSKIEIIIIRMFLIINKYIAWIAKRGDFSLSKNSFI